MVGAGPPVVVVQPRRPRLHCTECHQGPLPLLVLEHNAPHCLDCADLGHLSYLPRGNAALTRRAREASSLWAVVLRHNSRRTRYERQGILVEERALLRAEAACLADADARARRRERDAARRAVEDVRFTATLTAEILRLFPCCPPVRAEAVATHTSLRGSGRVGRSAAGRSLDEGAVTAAVRAAVRHDDTAYDALLMSGVRRDEARRRMAGAIETVLAAWRRPNPPRGSPGHSGRRDA
ncbi:DUF2293 domain-containing protein [Streptomyces sp. A5-4]|uniref:DUF2293 domain-containing protein n=1 Tax=Streptomyces sp. A5-4 TaxID=3384771 RepID=UPI003DAA155D